MSAHSKNLEVNPQLIRDFQDWRSRWMKDRATSMDEAMAAFCAGHLIGSVRLSNHPDAMITARIPDLAGLIPKEFMRLFKDFADEEVTICVFRKKAQ
jgi:hypothetical protein